MKKNLIKRNPIILSIGTFIMIHWLLTTRQLRTDKNKKRKRKKEQETVVGTALSCRHHGVVYITEGFFCGVCYFFENNSKCRRKIN